MPQSTERTLRSGKSDKNDQLSHSAAQHVLCDTGAHRSTFRGGHHCKIRREERRAADLSETSIFEMMYTPSLGYSPVSSNRRKCTSTFDPRFVAQVAALQYVLFSKGRVAQRNDDYPEAEEYEEWMNPRKLRLLHDSNNEAHIVEKMLRRHGNLRPDVERKQYWDLSNATNLHMDPVDLDAIFEAKRTPKSPPRPQIKGKTYVNAEAANLTDWQPEEYILTDHMAGIYTTTSSTHTWPTRFQTLHDASPAVAKAQNAG